MKPTIDPRVRAKLEEIGVDAVKSKLLWIMNVRTLGQQDQREEDLGDGIKASRREIQEWLNAKTARERATWKVWIAPALTLIVIGIASTNLILTISANRPELVSTQATLFVVPAAKPPEWVTLNWNNIGKRSAHRGTVTLFTVSNDGNRHEKFAQSEITASAGGGTTLTPTFGYGGAFLPGDMRKFLGLFLACVKYHDEANNSYKQRYLFGLGNNINAGTTTLDELPSTH